MLRLLVALLVALNLGFYGWRQGWLDQTVGVRAQGDHEPARLAQQVQPERVRVLPEGASPTAIPASPPPSDTPRACVEIGPYTPAELAAAQAVLQEAALAPERVEDVRQETPAVWIVFMGPFPDRDARLKKVDELKKLKVAYEDIRQVPELGDGLALGRPQSDRAAAEKALADAVAKGVRTARIAQYAAPQVTHTLRVADADAALQEQLAGLKAPGLAGKAFAACR